MRGKFITLEGLDGAGKSTQLAWIEAFLRQRGIAPRVTREPGGTKLGEALRGLLLDPRQNFHPETEALLMFAARREHVDKVIEPALAEGTWVLCDRFTDASFAYQSGGSGVDWKKAEALEAWVHGSLQPDVTLYLDVSPERAKGRAGAVRPADRYEQERADFHERTRAAYLRRAGEHSQRIRIIDANGSMTEVQNALEQILAPLCGQVQ
jgi:dTMP kinase